MPAQRLTDLAGAAEYLGMSEAATKKAYQRGRIPCVRDGRRVRFDLRALERWIERNTVKAAS